MKYSILCLAAAAALAFGAGSAHAAGQLYSFESGLDGFAPNGGAFSITQSTIGATDGTYSMRTSVPSADPFVGALTGEVPAALTPDTTDITFDVTINPGEEFTGAYADIGITIFGEVGGNYGYQYQVDPASERNVVLADGTHTIDVPLVGTSPVDYSTHVPFSTLQGQGFVPTGVEFFFDRSTDSDLTLYIDNVQAVTAPEPASIGLVAAAGVLGLRRRRRA